MFDPDLELSSDLDWMLQSGQASDEMLVEALVNEYFSPVYRLALSILPDRETARAVTLDVFIRALLDVYRYRGQMGVHAWFYTNAMKAIRSVPRSTASRPVGDSALFQAGDFDSADDPLPKTDLDAELWRAFDALPGRMRLPLLLQYVHGWQTPDIARVLRIGESGIYIQRNLGRRKLLDSLRKKGFPERDLPGQSLDEAMSQSLQARWPAPDVYTADREQLIAEIHLQANRQGARRKQFAYLKESIMVGVVVVVIVGLIWGANILLPEPDVGPQATTAPTRRTGSQPTRSVSASRLQSSPTSSASPTLTPTPEGVFYIVQPGDTLSSIAEKLQISVNELLQVNRLPDPDALYIDQLLLIPGQVTPGILHSPTPVEPVVQHDPLSPSASNTDVLERFGNSGVRGKAWNTLWVDADVILYGSEGYSGSARVSRNQVWNSEDRFLAISGPTGRIPEEIFLRNGGDLYMAQPGKEIFWFMKLRDVPAMSQSMQDLNLVFNSLFGRSSNRLRGREPVTLAVVGSDQVAGREALILEQVIHPGETSSRLWMDARTGLVLRKQQFTDNSFQHMVYEVVVTNVAYDVDFPVQEIFDPNLPWRGGFAADYTGRPLSETDLHGASTLIVGMDPLPEPPPEGFDPSRLPLTFQYPLDFDHAASQAKVTVLAGEYSIGKVSLGNPWTMICDRSPDGKKVAYVSQPFNVRPNDARLHWFSLVGQIGELHTPLEEVRVTQLAFSPDSRSLAVFGYMDRFAEGSIYILDTETDTYRRLLRLPDAYNLTWSPDGQYLALIGRLNIPPFQEQAIVVDVDTREIIYSGSLNFDSSITANWPMFEWGGNFPVEMGDLSACTSPPKD